MASLEPSPKIAGLQHNNGPSHFGIAAAAGLQGGEACHSAMPSLSDSLEIGSKGETRFPYFSELSLEDVTRALSSAGSHSSQEGQPNLGYPVFCRNKPGYQARTIHAPIVTEAHFRRKYWK